MDAPDVHPGSPEAKYTDRVGKYYAIYVCLLILAALQFYIASLHLDTSAAFERMLLVAIVEAGIAVMFFMHLWAEKRSWFLFVVIFMVAVMGGLQYGWTDSNRMETGAPYTQPKPGVVQP